MLGSYHVIAFLATTQPAVAKVFYEVVLGLDLVEDNPAALVFNINGRILRVVKVEKLTPAPFTVLGWQVPDIRTAANALALKGVIFQRYDGFDQDDLGIWTAPEGAKVAWFKDPDGNTLSLTQE